MSQRRVIDHVRIFRDVLRKGVLVGAIAMVDEGAAGGALDGRLCRRRRGAGRDSRRTRRWVHSTIDVGGPMARRAVLAWKELGDREAEVARRQTLYGCAGLVVELEFHDRRGADGDARGGRSGKHTAELQ